MNSNSLDLLMSKHQLQIDELKEKMAFGDLTEGAIDDVGLLRYLLSARSGGVERAYETLCKARQFKRDNSEWLDLMAFEKEDEAMARLFQTTRHSRKKADGGPVECTRVAMMDFGAIGKLVDAQQTITRFMTREKLRCYAECDRVSRQTGQLVKMVSIIDLQGTSMWWAWRESTIRAALGKSSSHAALLCPQLLAATVFLHPSFLFTAIYNVAALVVSQQMLEKISVCSATHLGTTIADCPYIKRCFKSAADVPQWAGGSCDCSQCSS